MSSPRTAVETATINYRVADFLKKHPPFPVMDEADLLALAGRGRVKFFEANEYIVVQGDPYRLQVLVIQQGTVTLWDESGDKAELRDVRGTGDFIGIEQYNELDEYSYSARSASDVVVYVFPAIDFEALVLKYPYAKQYVSAYGVVTADYKLIEGLRDPKDVFLHDLVAGKELLACDAGSTIREAARYLLATGADAIAVMDAGQRARAVLTPKFFLEWIERGGRDADQPISSLLPAGIPAIASDASLADGTLAMSAADAGVLAITQDGSSSGQLHAVVTPRDLATVFGDQPVAIMREIRQATNVRTLRDLNQRSRAFVLRYLASASSVDWLAQFTLLADTAIVKRVISLSESQDMNVCWCFCGSGGRGETLTRLIPELVMIFDDDRDPAPCLNFHKQVTEVLTECGYLPGGELSFERPFYAANLAEWKRRYLGWIGDPILQEMYRARPLFDLRFIHGKQSLWQEIETTVRASIDGDFLYLLANDCLESLPPLTFFQDAVISDSGERSEIYRLEYSALRPLVDVGRVFGMASGTVLGTSTLERFLRARTLLPDHASIFKEASDTLRIILWQQGRVGISQNTDGAELPPSLLSRYDRQVLKAGFRSIHRLLEFTADLKWLKTF